MSIDFVTSAIRETAHRGADDLLTAGLGLAGLRAAAPAFADAERPDAAELRRRAIHVNWNGIADLGPLGGFGAIYGGAPRVEGREFHAFARLPEARSPHRVLVQVPDAFDVDARCLVVTAASGSRGIYGAIALAGAWGLPRGCAVAYTDKGAGSGYFDIETASGCALDGTRADAGEADLEFVSTAPAGAGVAVKHAHSGDNPEADWGRHVLQAAHFGLAMLDRAFPRQAPFTPANTRVIAVGLSNGGGAVLQAAGLDDDGMLAGVVALAPNICAPRGRPLYDYATEAALLMPCTLLDPRFSSAPFARARDALPPPWLARASALLDAGWLAAGGAAALAAEALDRLHASGWDDATIATAASTTAFDLWRACAVTYASSYARATAGMSPCGFRFTARDAAGKARAATPAERAAWWADSAGIAPGAGVFIDEPANGAATDPQLPGLLALRELWSGSEPISGRVRDSIAACAAKLPRAGLPLWIVHGREDGLLPIAFHAGPYVDWLRASGREPVYWPVAHLQHFDAFLAFPGFGDRYVPLLPYGYAALDRLWQHLNANAPLDFGAVPAARPRGPGKLGAAHLGMPDR